jgi:dihydroflavonol-4-reductase
MKAFVTGGTGFIGSRLVGRLVERGDEVCALVRSKEGKEKLEAAGAKTAWGDITDRESMRGQWPHGMQGCDIVFHLAAWYKLGARNWAKAEEINVGGTRNVLELALELGIPRIVYTSTVAVFGDTRRVLADESYTMPVQDGKRDFITEYDRTKWMAHYEVVQPLVARAAPVITVLPCVVYGPGDPSLFGQLMAAWYRGLFPVFPGPETSFNYAHIDDVVQGHLLAADKGRLGESYILAGPALSYRELVPLWARLTGKAEPVAYLPAALLQALAPFARSLGDLIPGWPELLSADALRSMGVTYISRSDKAHTELGWTQRPLEDGMRQTLDWIAGKTQAEPLLTPQQKRIGGMALAAGLVLLISRRMRSRRRR